jgi:hypothetical protein
MVLKRSLSDSSLCFSKEAFRFKLHRLAANKFIENSTNESCLLKKTTYNLKPELTTSQSSAKNETSIADKNSLKRKANESQISSRTRLKKIKADEIENTQPSTSFLLEKSSSDVSPNKNSKEVTMRTRWQERKIKQITPPLRDISVNNFKSTEITKKKNVRGRPKVDKNNSQSKKENKITKKASKK